MQALPWLALERLQIPSDLGSLWGGEGIKSTQQAFRHEGGFRFTFTDLDSALFLSSLPNIKIQGWVKGRQAHGLVYHLGRPETHQPREQESPVRAR